MEKEKQTPPGAGIGGPRLTIRVIRDKPKQREGRQTADGVARRRKSGRVTQGCHCVSDTQVSLDNQGEEEGNKTWQTL